MRIAPNTFVTVRVEFDSSGAMPQPARTLSFIHGLERLLFDLDRRLEGLLPGDTATTELKPFGDHRDDLVTTISASALAEPPEAAPGEWCDCQTRTGERVSFRLLARDGDQLRCDFNHPDAGRVVTISAHVIEVRAATPEEIATASQRCSSG